MKLIRISLTLVALLAAAGVTFFFTLAPNILGSLSNQVAGDKGEAPNAASLALHQTLVVGDLHADSALWNRDLMLRGDYGQVDLPRLLAGNFALQMFTTVTKSPRGQNYEANTADAPDNISLLALAQRWPAATRNSLLARALFQGEKIHALAARSDEFLLIRSQNDLDGLMARRQAGEKIVGGLLGTEGSHALDGNLANIERLYAAGFRMMSLQHFFDNKLGGSLQGESNAGLTAFGEAAVDEMLSRGIMIDVAHSSEQVVRDVIARTGAALIVSHSGFKGHCDRKRNISDATMQLIAQHGGLIGVGFWSEAVCGQSVAAIIGSIRYGIDLVGLPHVALGSDWDGSVSTPIDAADAVQLTHAMRTANFSDAEIRAVMGGNMLRFLQTHLPEDAVVTQ